MVIYDIVIEIDRDAMLLLSSEEGGIIPGKYVSSMSVIQGGKLPLSSKWKCVIKCENGKRMRKVSKNIEK